jgi:hypothetical protein
MVVSAHVPSANAGRRRSKTFFNVPKSKKTPEVVSACKISAYVYYPGSFSVGSLPVLQKGVVSGRPGPQARVPFAMEVALP